MREVNACHWQPVELDILASLALRIRVLTTDQVARGWAAELDACNLSALNVLARLKAASLIVSTIVEAHPLQKLVRPLLSWKVGNSPPDAAAFERVANVSRMRWRLAHTPVQVFNATKECCALFGAFVDNRQLKYCEATHDAHLSEVYLHYRLKKPRLAKQWCGEATIPKLGRQISRMKDPDAFLISPTGAAERVIEFVGIYEPDHLAMLHEHCAGQAANRMADRCAGMTPSILSRLYAKGGTSYELW